MPVTIITKELSTNDIAKMESDLQKVTCFLPQEDFLPIPAGFNNDLAVPMALFSAGLLNIIMKVK